MSEVKLETLKRLIDTLESEDAFERRQAIENLALLTQQRLDFAWRGNSDERAASIRRWRRWLSREEKRRKGGDLKATLDVLASGVISGAGPDLQAALEKAFKDLPPQHKKALIAQ